MERWTIIILGILVAGLSLWQPAAVVFPRSGVWPADADGVSEAGVDALRAENAALRARLEALEGIARELHVARPPGGEGIAGIVLASYPFNFKHEFLAGAGTFDGVRAGDAAIAGSAARASLIGRAVRVFDHTTLVRTIFDPSFEEAVRVGSGAVEALLVGGSEPRLTLIAKHAVIAPGDPVYAAAAGAPYGLLIGTVRETSPAADQLFMEAALDVPRGSANARAVVFWTGHR